MLYVSIDHPTWLSSLPHGAPGVELRYETPPRLYTLVEGRLEAGLPLVEEGAEGILSYHNFECTPEDLEEIFSQIIRHKAFKYKIACMAHSTCDALRLLHFGSKHPNLSVIPMGERGSFARVLAPIFGNTLNFACIDATRKTAPGQLSFDELEKIYHFSEIGPHTKIFGLIGDPVEQSLGHLYHNSLYRAGEAVYVKMQVGEEELATFFPLAKALGFSGLSVTRPLKEKVLPFCDHVCSGTVNTLVFREGIWGMNTDGKGALDALEQRGPVQGKRIALLGRGGVGKAIATTAKERGAEVVFIAREEREKPLPPHHILINCTPESLPIAPEYFHAGTLVMDCVYVPKETRFLHEARARGCHIVYGEELFFNQAKAQHALWF